MTTTFLQLLRDTKPWAYTTVVLDGLIYGATYDRGVRGPQAEQKHLSDMSYSSVPWSKGAFFIYRFFSKH